MEWDMNPATDRLRRGHEDLEEKICEQNEPKRQKLSVVTTKQLSKGYSIDKFKDEFEDFDLKSPPMLPLIPLMEGNTKKEVLIPPWWGTQVHLIIL